jgi:hypothetical protein
MSFPTFVHLIGAVLYSIEARCPFTSSIALDISSTSYLDGMVATRSGRTKFVHHMIKDTLK